MLSQNFSSNSVNYAAHEALGVYHTYFNAFDNVVSSLANADDPDALLEMLRTLGEASRSSMTGLYLNEADGKVARMVAAWRDQECHLATNTPQVLILDLRK